MRRSGSSSTSASRRSARSAWPRCCTTGTTRIVTAGVVRAAGTPIAKDTEFEIGSVTKTFTSLLLADMVVRGEASLDDAVTRHLPTAKGLARDGKPVTLAQLATHTSGLPPMPRNFRPANRADPYADYDGGKLVAFLSQDVLDSAPGREYRYSTWVRPRSVMP